MTVILSLREVPDIPLEADTITPTHFAGKGVKEIEDIPVQQGNEVLKLKDFFDVRSHPLLIVISPGSRVVIDGRSYSYQFVPGACPYPGRIRRMGMMEHYCRSELLQSLVER